MEKGTPEMDQEARLLFVMEPLKTPVIDAAIETLHLPPGSRGLDVGCGVGLQAARLAEAVGPGGLSPASMCRPGGWSTPDVWQSNPAWRNAFRFGKAT